MERRNPAEEMPYRIGNNGILWCSGIGILSRFRKTRSPRTALDAQLPVDAGFPKMTGFRNIHTIDTPPGIKHHQPIQTLVQNANMMNGNTENRVQTLIGLACLIQFSSDK